MIKKFIVKNYLNEILELELTNPEESGFIVKEVTGLGPDKATINIKEIANNDGGYFNSARTPVKNIVMHLLFIGTPMIEDTRHKSYRFFSTKKPLTFTVVTDRNELSINGYIESNEPDIFSEEEGCQISILCPFPYFSSDKKQIVQTLGSEGLFEFPFNNELIPDPYIEEVIEEGKEEVPEQEIEVPEQKELIYSLSDNKVSAVAVQSAPFNHPPTGNVNHEGTFPFRSANEWVNKIYYYLPFNWERDKYGTFLDNEYCYIEFDYYMVLEMGKSEISKSSITLRRPTYYVNDNPDPIEMQLFDKNGNEINNLEEYKVIGSYYNNDASMLYYTLKLDLLIKIPSNLMNDINSLNFNALFQHQENINILYTNPIYDYRAQVEISNVKFYKVNPKHIEIIPAIPAVPPIIEKKPRVEDCLIDETLPDYQFEQDDKTYNIQVSEGIIFGETNRYQFNHVISYNGTKDVGIIMTIEFENNLTISSYEEAGYLVITNTRYPGDSIIIDFKKVTDLIKEALGQSDPDMEGDGGITGPPPLPSEETYSRPSAQKGDILTIDTRTGHKNVYYQRPGDWKYGNRRFSVLGAVNQDAAWFSIYQGDNIFGIRHTFHPYLDDLQESDKDLVHADLLMVQTENDVLYEGV